MRITRIRPLLQLAIAWSTMFLIGTELFVMSPLIPFLAADFRISTAVAGVSVTVFSATYMVSAPVFGNVADRVGRRRVLVSCLLIFTAANLLTASATSLASLLAARFLAGAAAAGVSPSVYALIDAAAPSDRRATWLGLVVSGLLMSLAFGASAGAIAGARFGWSPVFVLLGIFSLMFAAVNWQVWPHEALSKDASKPQGRHPFASAVLARRLAPTVIWSMGLYGAYTYLGAGLVAIGFSTDQIAEAILFYGCGAIVGVLIGGHVADRVGVKFTTGASLAGLCVCFLVLRAALDTGVFVGPALGVSSAVAQLFFPAQQASLVKEFPNQRGTALAWNNSALFFGISLGSLCGGIAVTLVSFDANLTVCASIALIACLINRVVSSGTQQRS
jgi:predicted MFS family arabinose efflux permease